MALNIQERLVFNELLPASGDLLQQSLVKDLLEKVFITPEEAKKVNMKTEDNVITWEDRSYQKKVAFTPFELKFLKQRVKILDSEKKVTQNNLSLFKKIEEAVV